MSDEPRFQRERCLVCQKSCYRTYDEAARDAKRMGRWKQTYKGLKAYWSPECATFHIGEGGDHGWRKVARETLARRKDDWA